MEFLYGHGAFSQPTYEQLKVQCPDFTNPNTLCEQWLDKMSAEAGPYNGYNLYDDCGPNDQMKTWREHQASRAARHSNAAGAVSAQVGEQPDGSGRGFGYPCGKQNGAVSWANDPAVRKALHVPEESFYGYKFNLEQIEPPFNYTSDVASLVPTYRRLIPAYKVLIYNGDIDPCVPYNGNEEWTRGLGLQEIAPWTPWQSDPGTGMQIAGAHSSKLTVSCSRSFSQSNSAPYFRMIRLQDSVRAQLHVRNGEGRRPYGPTVSAAACAGSFQLVDWRG